MKITLYFHKYESIIILNPNLQVAEVEELANKYTKLFTDWASPVASKLFKRKEEIVEIRPIEKHNLAYEVKHHTEGWYLLFTIWTAEENIVKLERYYRIDSNIIKFMNVNLDRDKDGCELPELKVEVDEEEYDKIKLGSPKSEQSSYPEPDTSKRPAGQNAYDYLFGYTDKLDI